MCPKLHLHQYKGKYYQKARVDLSSSGSGAFVRCGNPGLTLQSIPSCYFLQGSYKCGACKPGFVGDQITGCKSQSVRRCPNGEISPCHEKAECVVERDGSISCVVRAKPPPAAVLGLAPRSGAALALPGLPLPSPGDRAGSLPTAGLPQALLGCSLESCAAPGTSDPLLSGCSGWVSFA